MKTILREAPVGEHAGTSDTRRKGRQHILLNVVLLMAAAVFCCIALELAVRVIFARSLDFSMEMWKYATQLKQPVPDPLLRFVHAPNRSALLMGVPVSINSHGLRDREYSQAKPPDVYRIVVLGDSTTFGWGVPLEQTVAKILEDQLNKAQVPGYRHFEVLNAGTGNYNTVQEVTHYLTYERAFSPDLLILQYFINDAEPIPKERKLALLGRSYLLAFTISRIDAIMRFTGVRPDWKQYYASLYEDGQPGLEAAKQALGKLASSTDKDGVRLLVTILPELHEINKGYPFVAQHQKIRDLLVANHVPVIELIDALRGHGPESSLFVTPADAHPNGKANALIVRQILPWILDNLRANRNDDAVYASFR
jgi:lysophospholipase L1-like esterase